MSTNIVSQPTKKLIKVNSKVIGYIEGNRFVKQVTGSRHFLTKPPGWAIDVDAFDYEIKPNATQIIIKDRGKGLEYHCSTEIFEHHSFKFNRGHGNQYGCPIAFFRIESNGHKQLSLWEGENIV